MAILDMLSLQTGNRSVHCNDHLWSGESVLSALYDYWLGGIDIK